ncbi:CDP-glucose 4,6-dehydratase [Calycomorphotria hydatis]|uniref:CDP-glucose 4,6-dehydratase n=2 Tax=Calycomorphotria hydatis TaxID=2528027 RepID=A0A517T7E8_9PLAN|nr:CDP-glucose 4,6-dehydratase [Calycomorphotria hydatis]
MNDHGLSDLEDSRIRILDVRDQEAVNALMAETEPDIVFHLAAQPLVRSSYASPVETFSTNVLGTAHMLDAVRQCLSVRAIVNVTSDKCYENREWCWPYRETESMGGHDPYSASKGCSELITSSFRRSFFTGDRQVGVATGRAGNVIGGGDFAVDRLIPDIVRQWIDGEPVVIRRPLAIRPWQHVIEAISGYLLLGIKLFNDPARFNGAWNFGPDDTDAVNVRDLTAMMMRAWGSAEVIEEPGSSKLHEAHYLKLDSNKAKSELQWSPLLSIQERVDWTINWYRDWSVGHATGHELIDAQIDLYERKLSDQFSTEEAYSANLVA